VAIDASWESYREELGKKLASELRRRRRRLEEAGRFSFEVLDGDDRLAELLDEGFAVEAAGWKGERDSAICSRPRSSAWTGGRSHSTSASRTVESTTSSKRATTRRTASSLLG
jgi:hypothetical protein